MKKQNNCQKIDTLMKFPEGEKTPACYWEEEILVYNDNGKFYAFERKCLHQSWPLDDAKKTRKKLSCICHAIKFELKTGRILQDGSYVGLPYARSYLSRAPYQHQGLFSPRVGRHT